ncbi:MAG: hypothetical protein VB130_09740 [Clostridium sp.]|nr:hypothetical protein [Clostridium sp.]
MAINYKVCPQCGSKKYLEIVYGYPGPGLLEEVEQGKIIFGGCCVSDEAPEYACSDCNKQWSKKEVVDAAYKSIRRIRASVGGYFAPSYNVSVDLVDMKTTWEEGFQEELQHIKKISKAEAEDFIIELKFIGLLNWKRKYVNSDILDGTQWSIDIETDKRKIHKYGSNDFPGHWDTFCSLIERIVGRPFA